MWYKKGIKFQCLQCGICCSGFEGYVWLSPEDEEKIIAFLKISRSEFRKKYAYFVKSRLSLKEKKNLECIFYKDTKCQIYKARPKQCSTFPFWEHCFRSEKDFDELKNYCPGIDHDDAKKYSFEEIQKKLNNS